MSIVQSSICRAAVLALASAGLAQADPVVTPSPTFNQTFSTVAPVITGGKNVVSPTPVTGSSSVTFNGFDVNQGVLTGATFNLGLVNDGAGLFLRSDSSDQGPSSVRSSFAAGWQILGTGAATPIAAAPMTTLISHNPVGTDVPTLNADQKVWTQTRFELTAGSDRLNDVLGAGKVLTSQIDSRLQISRIDPDPQKANKPMQAFLSNSSGAAQFGSLIGSATYTYLAHASGTLALSGDAVANGLVPEVYLSASQRSTELTVMAGGLAGSATTGLDFNPEFDIACVGSVAGACDQFKLNLGGFSNLAAGTGTSLGTIDLAGDAGNFSATYTLTLHDTAGVGASASQRHTVMSFVVESGVVSSVPEAKSYAMFIAGLGFLGMTARRRRAGGQVQSR